MNLCRMLRLWKSGLLKRVMAGEVAFDTETDSLDAVSAKLVGFSLSVAPGEACYVPLGHVVPGEQGDLFGSEFPSPPGGRATRFSETQSSLAAVSGGQDTRTESGSCSPPNLPPGGEELRAPPQGGGRDRDLQQIPLADALALLKPLLEDRSVLKIGQNIKYDMLVMGQHGIWISPIADTMVLSYVLDSGGNRHNMDEFGEVASGDDTDFV